MAKIKNERPLTAERLKDVLDYDPETGKFTWRIFMSPRAVPGQNAGRWTDEYRHVTIDGVQYKAARLAWFYAYGSWPEKYIDHANGDKGDDRIANLREASPSQNAGNAKRNLKNTSGLKGAHKSDNHWYSCIKRDGVYYYLGSFKTAEEAHQAYVDGAQRLFGEFARAA